MSNKCVECGSEEFDIIISQSRYSRYRWVEFDVVNLTADVTDVEEDGTRMVHYVDAVCVICNATYAVPENSRVKGAKWV